MQSFDASTEMEYLATPNRVYYVEGACIWKTFLFSLVTSFQKLRSVGVSVRTGRMFSFTSKHNNFDLGELFISHYKMEDDYTRPVQND